MKVGEILRKVADRIDAVQAKQSAEELIQQSEKMAAQANSLAQQAADQAMSQTVDQAPDPEEVEADNTDCTNTDSMVSPLQQKHELLKKATGVENNVDEFSEEDPEDVEVDEIEIMKKMAGIGKPDTGCSCQEVSDTLRPFEINPKKNAALVHFASDNYDAE